MNADELEQADQRSRCVDSAAAFRLLQLPDDARILAIAGSAPSRTVLEALAPFVGTVDIVDVGSADTISATARYDAIVAWDAASIVLEHDPKVNLTQLAQHLTPNGFFICAVHNALGVRYLAGASDVHNDPFGAVEGLQRNGRFAVTHRELCDAFLRHGFTSALVLHGSPSLYGVRTLVHPKLFSDARFHSLLTSTAGLPSPDLNATRWPSADERALWETLVHAGDGAAHSNAYIAIAGRDQLPTLWNQRQIAAFTSNGRRPETSVTTRFFDDRTSPSVHREYVDPSLSPPSEHRLVVVEPYIGGPVLSDMIVDARDPDEAAAVVRRWWDFAQHELSVRPGQLDLLPHNVKDLAGTLVAFDQEWIDETLSVNEILERGIAYTASLICDRVPADGWLADADIDTELRAINWLCTQCSYETHDRWFEAFLEREGRFQQIATTPVEQPSFFVESRQRAVDVPIIHRPRNARSNELRQAREREQEVAAANAKLERARQTVSEQRELLDERMRAISDNQSLLAEQGQLIERLRNEVQHLEAELSVIVSSRVWRTAEKVRQLRRHR